MNFGFLNPETLFQKAREYSRKLWVRVIIMGLLAFVSLGLAEVIGNYIPPQISAQLTGAAADRLLDIIANAMLVVTTFSITVMVTVYRSSSAQWTPRVHRLIIEDRTTQNTLAVFIGAYVYALLAIILRELTVFGDDRALALFVTTVLVLAVIVFYLIRWVLHLQSFGSLMDTTRQIESVTRARFHDRLKNPCLGARPLTKAPPDDTTMIPAPESGYIQHIYAGALQEVAKAHGYTVYLPHSIGSFVFINEPLLQVQQTDTPKDPDCTPDTLQKHVLANIRIGDLRTYDQDPRFGLMVMGEIASKALSPGINDPGTAIDVITRIGRVLSAYENETKSGKEIRYPNLYIPPLDPVDLIDDGFSALARDGATVVEVQQRLQACFTGLMRHPDPELAAAARDAAARELDRAIKAMTFEPDRARVIAAAAPELRPEKDRKTAARPKGEEIG